MKKTALTLLLLSTIYGSYAQTSNVDAEGRRSAATGATRGESMACRAQANDQQLSGKERRAFMRNCVREEASTKGASGSGATSSGPGLDAEGRPSMAAGGTRTQAQACRAEAVDKKMAGAERRAFMRECMAGAAYSGPSSGSSSGSSTTSGGTGTVAAPRDAEDRPQAKGPSRAESKECAREANEKNLKGAERRQFMRTCVH